MAVGKNDGNNENNSSNDFNSNTSVNMLIDGNSFNAEFVNKGIKEIYFKKEKPQKCNGTQTDVSLVKDGRIMACLDGEKLVVSSEEKIYANTDSRSMFNGATFNYNDFRYLEKLNFQNFDTSKVRLMNSMFSHTARYSTSLDISYMETFDTSNVTKMQYIFHCAFQKVKHFKIDISNWDTSNVTSLEYSFYGCNMNSETATVGDLNKWNVQKITNFNKTFGLTLLTIPKWFNT